MSTSTPTRQPVNRTDISDPIKNTRTQEDIDAAGTLLILRKPVIFSNNDGNQTPDSQATVSAVEIITRTPTPMPASTSTSRVANTVPKRELQGL